MRKLTAQLTVHAKLRLAERTSLQESEFISILNEFRTASIGYRKEAGHWHRLFFSLRDQGHFVAIQDICNGEVITILPLDFHAQLAWPVSERQKQKAIQMADQKLHDEMYRTASVQTIPAAPGTKMDVIGVIEIGRKTVNLGTHRFVPSISCPEDALLDDAFVSKLLGRTVTKRVPIQAIEELMLVDRRTSLLLKVAWADLQRIAANEIQCNEA